MLWSKDLKCGGGSPRGQRGSFILPLWKSTQTSELKTYTNHCLHILSRGLLKAGSQMLWTFHFYWALLSSGVKQTFFAIFSDCQAITVLSDETKNGEGKSYITSTEATQLQRHHCNIDMLEWQKGFFPLWLKGHCSKSVVNSPPWEVVPRLTQKFTVNLVVPSVLLRFASLFHTSEERG